MPAGATLAAGRVADLMQRLMPGRLPFNHEGIWISSLQPHCDDSRTGSELGVVPRDLRVTLSDTVRWLADRATCRWNGPRPVAQVKDQGPEPAPIPKPSGDLIASLIKGPGARLRPLASLG